MYIMTTPGFKAESYRQEAIGLAIKWANVAYSIARKLNIGSQNASTADGERLSASAILLQNDSPATSLAQANYHLQICRHLVKVASQKIWLNNTDKTQADEILDRLGLLIEQEKEAIGID